MCSFCVPKKVKVLVAQSCPTLCNPMDCSSPGPSVCGISQAGILEWVAIPFSRGSSPPRDRPRSPALQADSLPSKPPWASVCSLCTHGDHSLLEGRKGSHRTGGQTGVLIYSYSARCTQRGRTHVCLILCWVPGTWHRPRELITHLRE